MNVASSLDENSTFAIIRAGDRTRQSFQGLEKACGMECGDALRPFRLASTIEEFLDANDCVGASLVVVFYLRDGSEDDSKLLSGFRDLQDQFEKLNVKLAAVGLEPIDAHKAFAERLGLKFPLLSDPELKLARDFGVVQQTQLEGKPALELRRATFFFDVSLRVAKVYPNPPVDGHAQLVLNDAQAWLNREEPHDVVRMRQCC